MHTYNPDEYHHTQNHGKQHGGKDRTFEAEQFGIDMGKARKDIGLLLDNKIKLAYVEKVGEKLLEDMLDVEILERYRERLHTAFYALEEISGFLSASLSPPQKQGRPPVDKTGFVKSIVNAYRRHIDEPTTYRDGPFFETVQIILRAVNMPSEDPSRTIQAALK